MQGKLLRPLRLHMEYTGSDKIYFHPQEKNITLEGKLTPEFSFQRKLRLFLMFLQPQFQIETPLRSDPTAGNANEVYSGRKLRH